MFDNTRFFHAKSKHGRESGWKGWVEITARGRRNSLPHIDFTRSGLIVVDMQRECCEEWPNAIAKYDPQLAQLYRDRLRDKVIPNTVRLLELFRRENLVVVFLSLDAEGIIPEIAPSRQRMGQGNWWNRDAKEFVLPKFSSGAFATSAIDNVLRENNLATLFFTGVDTCGCVDGTMSEAYDRCYQTILIEDACCSSRPELHEAAVKIWSYKGFVRTTGQVIHDFPWDSWIDHASATCPGDDLLS